MRSFWPPDIETTLAKLLTMDSQAQLLVIDDSAVARKILTRQLAQSGYRVHEAENGASALQQLEQTPVDLVLMDFFMEPMSGMELLERIRQLHTPEQLPVLMMSASKNAEALEQATRLGANDFLWKPFTTELLLSKVQAHLK